VTAGKGSEFARRCALVVLLTLSIAGCGSARLRPSARHEKTTSAIAQTLGTSPQPESNPTQSAMLLATLGVLGVAAGVALVKRRGVRP
jgi:hypothetical protein